MMTLSLQTHLLIEHVACISSLGLSCMQFSATKIQYSYKAMHLAFTLFAGTLYLSCVPHI